jgi:hypothetical protein
MRRRRLFSFSLELFRSSRFRRERELTKRAEAFE